MVAATPTVNNLRTAAEALLAELEAAATPYEPASYIMEEMSWSDGGPSPVSEGRWRVFSPGRTIIVRNPYPDGLSRTYHRFLDTGAIIDSPSQTALLTRDEALLLLAGHLAETVAVPV